MPTLDPVVAPAGFVLLFLVWLVPAYTHGLEQTVKSVVVVDESSVDWFGTVDVQSKVPDTNPASLHAQLRALPDGVSTAQAIDKTVETITSALRKHGQTFVQVHPRIDPDLATHTVDVVSIVEEGPHVHVERITIRGKQPNSRVRDPA